MVTDPGPEGSKSPIHFKRLMEGIRIGKGTASKTVAGNTVEGSNPSPSALF